MLEALPEGTERDERELSLRISVGRSFLAARGYAAPEVGVTYARAQTLCLELGDLPQLFPMLEGLRSFYTVRAELEKALELARRFHRLASEREDPILRTAADFIMGNSLFHLGELVPGGEHLERAIARYDPRQHASHARMFGIDLGVFSLSYAAHVLWHLGEPERGLARSREALALADDVGHPFSRVIALSYAAMLHQFRSEARVAGEQAGMAVALSDKHGFPYYRAWGTIMQGWARAEDGALAGGIEQMRRGLAELQETGADLRRPYYLALVAGACGKAGRAAEGLALLDEALALVRSTGERWREAELHRLRGELLLAQGSDPAEAEACFHRAIDIGRRQGARSLVLRAATSLYRLQSHAGRNASGNAMETPPA